MSLPNKDGKKKSIKSVFFDFFSLLLPLTLTVKHSCSPICLGLFHTSLGVDRVTHVIFETSLKKCLHTLWNAHIAIREQLCWNDSPLLFCSCFKFWYKETSRTSSTRQEHCNSCETIRNSSRFTSKLNTCFLFFFKESGLDIFWWSTERLKEHQKNPHALSWNVLQNPQWGLYNSTHISYE